MSRKLILQFAAAVLVVFLSNGASEAKSVARQDVPAGCPKPPPGLMTICSIGPNWCATSDDCKDGKICCPWGCGGECMEPVEEGNPPPVVEEGQPTPVSDPCYSPFSPMIYCSVAVNRCKTHEECGNGRVCCPIANCGKRCQRALVA